MAGQIPDSNRNVNWNSPEWVVTAVKEVYGGEIFLDPCSNPGSIVGARRVFSLPNENGLEQVWSVPGGVYINPPYGRCILHKTTLELLDPKLWKDLPAAERDAYSVTSIEDWVKKAADTNLESGTPFTLLIPAYVNARYFHTQVFERASAVCFPKGRFSFVGADSTAAFHVCLPFYGNKELTAKFTEVFSRFGKVVAL